MNAGSRVRGLRGFAAAVLAVACVGITGCSQPGDPGNTPLTGTSVPRTLGYTARDPDLPALPRPSPLRYGLTLDTLADLNSMIDVLSSLPRRLIVRVVFDVSASPSTYLAGVKALASSADVMGELLDSSDVSSVSVAAYAARARSYVAVLGDSVSIWEVGNEVNGEWLGTSRDVVAKVAAAYDAVTSAGRVSALTAYYNPKCWEQADHEMLPWLKRNLPERMKAGLGYVLVSYYEGGCNGYRPTSWAPVFGPLAAMFPGAKVGFGEVGMSDPVTVATLTRARELLTYYYGLRIDTPRYIGGWFWWYGAQDVLRGTRPLLGDFRAAIG